MFITKILTIYKQKKPFFIPTPPISTKEKITEERQTKDNIKQETQLGETVKVVNLSSKNLTTHQINLLSRGLKYTPTPKQNIEELSKENNKNAR